MIVRRARDINHSPPILILLLKKKRILDETLLKPLYHDDRATWRIMIGARGNGWRGSNVAGRLRFNDDPQSVINETMFLIS